MAQNSANTAANNDSIPTNSTSATTCDNSNINNVICKKSNFNIIAYNLNTAYEELGTAYDEPNTTYDGLIHSGTNLIAINGECLEHISTEDQYLPLHDEPLQPIATDFNFVRSTQKSSASLLAGKLRSALPLLADTQRPALPLPHDTQRPALPLPRDTPQRHALPLHHGTQRPSLSRRSDTQQLTLPRRANSDQQSALDDIYQQPGADSHNALGNWWRSRR
jgi:hypothetical protein